MLIKKFPPVCLYLVISTSPYSDSKFLESNVLWFSCSKHLAAYAISACLLCLSLCILFFYFYFLYNLKIFNLVGLQQVTISERLVKFMAQLKFMFLLVSFKIIKGNMHSSLAFDL